MPKYSEKPVLLPDRLVAARYDVSIRSLERWDLKPDLGFPAPVRINGRRYRAIAELENWERKTAASRSRARRAGKPHTIEAR